MIRIHFSHLAIAISFVVIGFIILSTKFWREEHRIIESDVISYYAYLPSIFIYQDASLSYWEKAETEVQSKVWFQRLEGNRKVLKMTMGVSFFYLPFFIVAHHFAQSSDYAANGFTLPYRMAVALSSFFYFLLALYFLRKFLIQYFDDITVFWTLLIVGIGTNLVSYVTKEPGMSHVYSFFLFSVFLYLSSLWHKYNSLKTMLLIGLIMGLIVLVRPINIFVLLFFIFYRVSDLQSFQNKLKLIYDKRMQVLKGIGIAFLVVLPQLLYWKYNTGSWIFYSYTDNERFFLGDSKIIDGLFSFRKGWLLYTPLMALALIGMLWPSKTLRNFRWGLLIFTSIFTYFTFAWWCWWYGGSFGMRPMIDAYPLFSIPIAAFIYETFKVKISRIFMGALVSALLLLNLFQNYQYRLALINHDSMTAETYRLVWGETEFPQGFWESLSGPDYEAAKEGER